MEKLKEKKFFLFHGKCAQIIRLDAAEVPLTATQFDEQCNVMINIFDAAHYPSFFRRQISGSRFLFPSSRDRMYYRIVSRWITW